MLNRTPFRSIVHCLPALKWRKERTAARPLGCQEPTMDHRAKAEETYRAVQARFVIPGSGLYRQNYPTRPGDREFADCWYYGSWLSATVSLALLSRDKYVPVLHARLASLERFWQGPGYASYIVDKGGGDRYYDDNEWLGMELLAAYHLLKDDRWLARARAVWVFVAGGWSDALGGGIYWRERDTSTKNTCSNGPAIVMALQLFQATGERSYLDWAQRLYTWINGHLRSPDGVYWDSCSSAGQVDQRTFTYNTGIMVQANVLLYQVTRFEQYLDEARLLARASLEHFAGDRLDGVRIFPDNPWFNAVLLRGYRALADATGDSTCYGALLSGLDYGWEHARDQDGLLGADWSGRTGTARGQRPLLDQAAVVEMYASSARRQATAVALAGGATAETKPGGLLDGPAPVAGPAGPPGTTGMGAGTPGGLQPFPLHLGAELVSPLGTVGSYRRAGAGLVCDTWRTGPVPISAAIVEYYLRLGGPAGRLGFPLTAPIPITGSLAGTQGLLQRFEGSLEYPPDVVLAVDGVDCGATVYWSAAYGACLTWFEIGAAYELAGGPAGRLGFPTGERVALRPSPRGTVGYWQEMEGGAVYWGQGRGAVAVDGAIFACHARLGGVLGPLGFPVTPELPALPSPAATTGVFQRFEGQDDYPPQARAYIGQPPYGATIYWCALGGAHATWGEIGAYHESHGGSGGELGFPIGDVESGAGDGQAGQSSQWQQFERGRILWRLARGVSVERQT